ncbi:hypothetical protein GCM10022226_24760 [Sphaerisporangium flaviroseum]|uniref:DUF2218 domain-containing protein n=1 Tax=Sphaerisporangium flaviroseum TaxID=509199 RepID=A0ABP7I1J7_9ACTN
MLVVLTMRRIIGHPSGDSPVDGRRMLALLPRHWRKDLREGGGHIAIRIDTDDNTTTAQIRAQVVATLTNPEISRWRLVSCETVTPPRVHQPARPTPVPTARHIHQRSEWN